MHTNVRTPLIALTGAVVAASAAVLIAGPLDPPAGTVVSSYKTLTEVEPRVAISATNTPGDGDSLFKINQPGSYYLTANITGAPAKHGIEIDASGVTLDLNGFHLIGDPTTLAGIKINNIALTGVTVLNGTVRGWGNAGVDLSAIGTSAFRLEGVSSYQNTSDGFVLGTFGVAANCNAFANGANGFRGGAGSSIANCTARQNTGAGFTLSNAVTVSGCVASQNGATGFWVQSASNITACTSHNNTGEGFLIGSASTITGCVAQSNDLDGIRAAGSCLIALNQCQANGSGASDGAGILVTGSDNRIQDNNCATADTGIEVDSAGNMILRNTCSGNTTNYDIVASNYYGTIMERTGILTPLANGSAANSTLNTTDANANFSY